MSENDDQHLFERVARLLNQQREMYGGFEIGLESQRVNEIEDQTNKKAQKPQEVSEPKKNYAHEKEVTLDEQLAACKSLDELKSLCERSEVLKTDLENTNLVFGVGNPNAELMIVGEAPGENEDKLQEPFVGRAGQLLDKIIHAIDFKREDIYIANILKHRPPDNRNPSAAECEQSLPYLLRQIELVDPKLILCVGKIAGNTLLNSTQPLKEMRQKFHPYNGRELMVTYHPAALLRNQQYKRPTWEDVQKLRARYNELIN